MGMKKGDKVASLNPPMDSLFEAGDQLFALTEDDDTLLISGLTSISLDESVILSAGKTSPSKPEKCLILGWNRCAAIVPARTE